MQEWKWQMANCKWQWQMTLPDPPVPRSLDCAAVALHFLFSSVWLHIRQYFCLYAILRSVRSSLRSNRTVCLLVCLPASQRTARHAGTPVGQTSATSPATNLYTSATAHYQADTFAASLAETG